MIQATGSATDPSEPAFVAVGMADRVYISTLQIRRRMMWMTEFAVKILYSTSFSRICSKEILTLCADGLRLHTVETDCSVSSARRVTFRYYK
jgi:hypothetical protein